MNGFVFCFMKLYLKKKPHHDLNHDSEVQVPDFSLSVGLLMK